MTKHVVVSQAEPIEDLAEVSYRNPRMADYEGWDLQRLGTEFDRMLAEWRALRPAAAAAAERFEHELSKRGIDHLRDKKAYRALAKEIRDPALLPANRALDALTPVIETIRAAPPLTIQDIAVKLRALRFEMMGEEELERKDQDWDEQYINQFCDEIQALALARPNPVAQNIAEKIQQLAGEISEALNEYEEGEFSLIVSPSTHPKRVPFRFSHMASAEQRKQEIIRDVRELIGPANATERMKFLGKELKETAAVAYPDVTDWTMWEGEGESGNPGVFFYLTGNRKAGV